MKNKQSVEPSKAAEAGASPKDPRQNTARIDALMELMSRETEKAILFEIEAEQGSQVFVAGTFNDWNPTSHPLTYHPEDGVFRATLMLKSVPQEYKFVVNGVWQEDGKCPGRVQNDSGTCNSVTEPIKPSNLTPGTPS